MFKINTVKGYSYSVFIWFASNFHLALYEACTTWAWKHTNVSGNKCLLRIAEVTTWCHTWMLGKSGIFLDNSSVNIQEVGYFMGSDSHSTAVTETNCDISLSYLTIRVWGVGRYHSSMYLLNVQRITLMSYHNSLLDDILQQLFTDVRNLVESLGSNSTRAPCCFQARNITVINRPFETDMNPLPAIEDIFVSLPACHQLDFSFNLNYWNCLT